MKKLFALALATTTSLVAAVPAFAADVEINYWMWDGNQAPIYKMCADKFEAANPGIKIKITQDGWDNYWTTLTTGFVSGTAPDVFVNHISRFPELLANGVMVDLTDRIAADKVDMTAYKAGLAESWNKDGHQWGLPKDWDTIALVYNKKMLADAGVTEDEVKNLTWNPDDGGTFQTVVGKLTVDANGKHGGDAGFDKSKVSVFGFATDAADGYGQSQWSSFAVSAGFQYIDKSWGSKYFYDSPVLAKTLTWFRDLALNKGYSVSQEQAGNLGGTSLFAAGKAAIIPAGSWTINTLKDTTPFAFGFAPLPTGPNGRRSMFNGLADSIWAGSKHQDEAWKWVKYLGSAECQGIVGKAGIVFPARPEATDAAQKAHADQGIDVSAFTLVATPETTFPFPITDFGNQISTILNTAVSKVLLNQGDPATILKAANDEVNALF